jgi:hypothetical protein
MEKFSWPGLEIAEIRMSAPGLPEVSKFEVHIERRCLCHPTAQQLRDIAYHYLEAAAWLRERESDND